MFLGRTWASPLVAATLTPCAQGQLAAAALNMRVFYHTALIDAAVYGVLEVVAELAGVGPQPRRLGLGWCALPLCTPDERKLSSFFPSCV